ncbi:hypothetical protein [Leptolyngbya sp. FACHB-711]
MFVLQQELCGNSGESQAVSSGDRFGC